jgi:hypothetical protein
MKGPGPGIHRCDPQITQSELSTKLLCVLQGLIINIFTTENGAYNTPALVTSAPTGPPRNRLESGLGYALRTGVCTSSPTYHTCTSTMYIHIYLSEGSTLTLKSSNTVYNSESNKCYYSYIIQTCRDLDYFKLFRHFFSQN